MTSLMGSILDRLRRLLALKPKDSAGGHDAALAARLGAVSELASEITIMLAAVSDELAKIEKGVDLGALDDVAARIRLLAVNGALEAARSPQASGAFGAAFQDIDRLAAQARSQIAAVAAPGAAQSPALRQRLDLIRARLSAAEAGGPSRSASGSSSATSFRRVC